MRIIAGSVRGHKLIAPFGEHTRPTADRVREALFSIIVAHVRGSRVLDVFAGSGALALEALSRGADSAVLIDSDVSCGAVIERNIAAVRMNERARLMLLPWQCAFSVLSGQTFDIVFLDPPYQEVSAYGEVLRTMCENRMCAPDMIAVCEHPNGQGPFVPPEFVFASTHKYGTVGLTIVKYQPNAE